MSKVRHSARYTQPSGSACAADTKELETAGLQMAPVQGSLVSEHSMVLVARLAAGPLAHKKLLQGAKKQIKQVGFCECKEELSI